MMNTTVNAAGMSLAQNTTTVSATSTSISTQLEEAHAEVEAEETRIDNQNSGSRGGPGFSNVTLRFNEASNAVSSGMENAMDELAMELQLMLMMLGVPQDKAEEMANGMSGAGREMTNDPAAVEGATISAINMREINLEASSVSLTVDSGSNQLSFQAGAISFSEVNGELIITTEMDPLILDLDGNGIETSAIGQSPLFDMDGDGDTELSGWVAGNDALLALDRNGNGTIDNGKELFGDQHGAATGFKELEKFDENQDGAIDVQDPVYEKLQLMFEDGRLRRLQDEGITRIELDMIQQVDVDLAGGRLAETGKFLRSDGTQGTVGEVFFDVSA